MTKEKTLLIIGILIISLPNLGFPNIVEKISSFFLGLILIILAYAIHFEKNKNKESKKAVKQVKAREPKVRVREVEIKEEIKQEEKKEDDVVVLNNNIKEEITGFTFIKKETIKK